MDDTGRLVAAVRRRLVLVRFLDRLQDHLALAAATVLVFVAAARLLGHALPLIGALAATAGIASIAAGIAVPFRPVSRARAASEADRIMGTRERISTEIAVKDGRAADPLGYLPSLVADARNAAGRSSPRRVKEGLPLRLRRTSLLATSLALCLLLVRFLPVPGALADEEDPQVTREKEKVVAALKKLERKAARRGLRADQKRQEDLAKLLRRIRKEAARLAGQKPRRAEAVARLSRLEREVKSAARRFAGMKRVDPDVSKAEKSEALAELARALEAFENADLSGTRQKLSRLWDKIREQGADSVTAEEMASAMRAFEGLRAAQEQLAAALGAESEMMQRLLEGLGSPEELAQLAAALRDLLRAMEDAGLTEEMLRAMSGESRNYRMLQLTQEELRELLEALEQLRQMLECGMDIEIALGGLGGWMPFPGLRGRMLGGRPGAGRGDGTGGAGQGRGGDPGTSPDGSTTNPDLVPGMVGPKGAATLIRTVRSLPNPDSEPAAYEELEREASREAEDALRRGDIPRRYREYVRRFFGSDE